MAASSALPPPGAPAPRFRRWVAIWLAVVLSIAGIGALGYVAFFGWSVSDAIYMTVITDDRGLS